MAFQRLAVVLIIAFFLAGPATAWKTGELTVFWGRNQWEGSLREACDTGLYNTVIISFFSVFGHGKYWTDLSGHDVFPVGNDIKHCQRKNILVLLSIGGGGNDYSLPSSQSAAEVADHLWSTYLGGGRPGVFRPFGDAVLDGIDLFIEHGPWEPYDQLVWRLAWYSGRGAGRKAVHLTATPRCVFPDRNLNKALATGKIERLHIRFYDDARCSYNRAGLRGLMQQWRQWTSTYPRSKVYLGLEAANVHGDMVPLQALHQEVLPKVQDARNYGGIMLWDRFYDKRTNYGASVKKWA